MAENLDPTVVDSSNTDISTVRQGVFRRLVGRAFGRSVGASDGSEPVDYGIDYEAASQILPDVPLVVEASGAHEYPVANGRPVFKISHTEEDEHDALEEQRSLLNRPQLEILSSEGSGGLVLTDGSLAYKVARYSTYYSYIESEMALLEVLYAEGIAPKPIVLIDAAPIHRMDRQNPKRTFPNVLIPRKNGEGDLPVIVMEKLETASLADSLSASQMYTEYLKILQVGERLGLFFGDVEACLDTKTGSVKLIDVGATSHSTADRKYAHVPDGSKRDGHPSLTEEEFLRAERAKSLTEVFMRQKAYRTLDVEGFHELLETGGLEAYMKELWDAPKPAVMDGH